MTSVIQKRGRLCSQSLMVRSFPSLRPGHRPAHHVYESCVHYGAISTRCANLREPWRAVVLMANPIRRPRAGGFGRRHGANRRCIPGTVYAGYLRRSNELPSDGNRRRNVVGKWMLPARSSSWLPEKVSGLISKVTVEALNLRPNMLVNVTPVPAVPPAPAC